MCVGGGLMNNKTFIKETNELWTEIINLGLDKIIYDLISNKEHQSGMVYDYINLYYPDLLKKYSKRRFCKLLKNKGFIFGNFLDFLKKPNEWRFQYRFSKEQLSQFSRGGQIVSNEKRKQKKHFNPKQHFEWWVEQGYNHDDAKKLSLNHRRENSPRCVEFYIKKGFSTEEAKEKISTLCALGAIAALKITQKPKTEKNVNLVLEKLKISYITQIPLKVLNEFKASTKRSTFYYDVYIPKHNCVIEINGSYWHADPKIFKENDVVYLPGTTGVLAKDIWAADEIKKNNAIKNGFNYFCIWEKETQDINNLESVICNLLKLNQSNC
jgi:hypothetical protein